MSITTALTDPDIAGCNAYIAGLKSARTRAYADALYCYYVRAGGPHPARWPDDRGVSVMAAPAVRANVAYYLTGQGDRWGRVPKRHAARVATLTPTPPPAPAQGAAATCAHCGHRLDWQDRCLTDPRHTSASPSLLGTGRGR